MFRHGSPGETWTFLFGASAPSRTATIYSGAKSIPWCAAEDRFMSAARQKFFPFLSYRQISLLRFGQLVKLASEGRPALALRNNGPPATSGGIPGARGPPVPCDKSLDRRRIEPLCSMTLRTRSRGQPSFSCDFGSSRIPK